MKHRLHSLFLVMALVVLALPAYAQEAGEESTASDPDAAAQPAEPQGETFTEAGESGAALPEMVVEAQNEVRQSIQKGDFEIELSAAIVDSFYSGMDEQALGMSPVSGLKPHLNNLEKLASDQPPHYWLPEMSSSPVATFYPQDPEGHDVKSWELAITNFRGSRVKVFEGGGDPPDRIRWDGRTSRDEMLQVGYPYSYVFSVTDKGTNTYNYAGVSFRIPALDYERQGSRVLALSGGELFERHDAALVEGGRDWLVRATDEMRQHPYSPVRVIVVAEDLDLAEQRADAVATFLADSMILPREQVETESRQQADLRAEMDGHVEIVIEHAD